jgi:hypothetical protein
MLKAEVAIMNTQGIALAADSAVTLSIGKNIKEEMKKTADEKQLKIDDDFIDTNTQTVDKMMKVVFENYQIPKKQYADLIAILKLNFQKCMWMGDATGIVIAGYGEREIFPVVHNFYVGGKHN